MAQKTPPQFNGYLVCPHEHDRLSSRPDQTLKLTSRQQQVFDVLVKYVDEHRYPPSRQELAGLLHLSSPNAAEDHLKALDRKGYITLIKGKSRGITINIRGSHCAATELLRELVSDEPGARERALAFLEGEGGSL